MARKPRLIVLAVIAAIALGYFLYWRTAGVQAPRLFNRIKVAVETGNALGIVDQLHPGYQVSKQWPGLFDDLGGDPTNDRNRALVTQGLMLLFRQQQNNPFVMTYELHTVEPQDDGTVAATVSVTLATTSGPMPIAMEPLLRHRFVLQQDGWLTGRLYIKAHAPIKVSY
jgi:hypothetical protein